ncbi:MAG: RidA family protein [Acidobacteria bacterium]|nr:RidA family protein [Acidobacteriota bacterium]
MGKTEKSTKRKYINLPTRGFQAPYSDAVLVNDTLYISGRVGFDHKTGHPPEKLEDEIRLVMDGVKITLATAGMTMDDLVWVQVYCRDVRLFDRFNKVYKTYFGDDLPARSFIGAGALLHEGNFQIQAIAVKG